MFVQPINEYKIILCHAYDLCLIDDSKKFSAEQDFVYTFEKATPPTAILAFLPVTRFLHSTIEPPMLRSVPCAPIN